MESRSERPRMRVLGGVEGDEGASDDWSSEKRRSLMVWG